jgi:hypothetical protein
MVKYVIPGAAGSAEHNATLGERERNAYGRPRVVIHAERPVAFGEKTGDRNRAGPRQTNKSMPYDEKSSSVAVVVGGATSGNPFGHVALAIQGHGVFSFGTKTPMGSDLATYLRKQSEYRSSIVYVIPVTPDQAQTMANYMRSQESIPLPDPLSNNRAFVDTCAARTIGALMAAGFKDPMPTLFGPDPSIFPRSAANFGREYGTAHKIPQGGQVPESFDVFRATN